MNFEKYEFPTPHPRIIDFTKITFGKHGFATHTIPVKTFYNDIRNIPEFINEPVVDLFHFGMSDEAIIKILDEHNLSPELSVDIDRHRQELEVWFEKLENHISNAIVVFEKDLMIECGVDDISADMIQPVLELSRRGVGRDDYKDIATKFKSMVVAMTPMIEHYRATKS